MQCSSQPPTCLAQSLSTGQAEVGMVSLTSDVLAAPNKPATDNLAHDNLAHDDSGALSKTLPTMISRMNSKRFYPVCVSVIIVMIMFVICLELHGSKVVSTNEYECPLDQREDPEERKEDPVEHKEDPAKHKEDPEERKEDPVEHTEAPVEHKEDPAKHKEDPAKHKEDPVEHKEDPVEHTEAPVDETEDPVDETEDPVEQGKILVDQMKNDFLGDALNALKSLVHLRKNADLNEVKANLRNIRSTCHPDKGKLKRTETVKDHYTKILEAGQVPLDEFRTTGCVESDPVLLWSAAIEFFNDIVPLPKKDDLPHFGGLFEEKFWYLEYTFVFGQMEDFLAHWSDSENPKDNKFFDLLGSEHSLLYHRFVQEIDKVENDLRDHVEKYPTTSDSQREINRWEDSISSIAKKICKIPLFGPMYAAALGKALTRSKKTNEGEEEVFTREGFTTNEEEEEEGFTTNEEEEGFTTNEEEEGSTTNEDHANEEEEQRFTQEWFTTNEEKGFTTDEEEEGSTTDEEEEEEEEGEDFLGAEEEAFVGETFESIADALIEVEGDIDEKIHETPEEVGTVLGQIIGAMHTISLCGIEATLKAAIGRLLREEKMKDKADDVLRRMGEIFKITSNDYMQQGNLDESIFENGTVCNKWKDAQKKARQGPIWYLNLKRHLASKDHYLERQYTKCLVSPDLKPKKNNQLCVWKNRSSPSAQASTG